MSWEIEPLEECAEIHFGTRVTRRKDAGVAYPVYGGGGATFFIDDFNRENELVISRFAMSEKCVRFVEGKFFLNDSGLTVKTKNKVRLSQDFLEWQCRAKSPVIYSLGRGTAQKNLNTKEFKRLPFSIPPIEEQERIVEVLDAAFEAIDKAKANIERNLANARELFQSRLNDIFSNPSSGWDVKPLGEVCSIKHGYAFKSTYFATSGDFILLTPGNFHEEGGYRDRKGKTKYFTGEIPKEFILKKGDFLVAMTEQAVGLLGSSIVVPNSDVFLHNQRLGKVEVFEGVEWVNGFFAHQFNLRTFRSAVQQTASGTKVRHTSPKKLCAIHITIPEAQIQSQISVELDAMKKQCRNLEDEYEAELSSLEELRQSILEQAFEGRLSKPLEV